MLGLNVRETRRFFDPVEPEIDADLWWVGLALMAFSACLMIGAAVWIVI